MQCGIRMEWPGLVECWGDVPPSDGSDVSMGLLIAPPAGATVMSPPPLFPNLLVARVCPR